MNFYGLNRAALNGGVIRAIAGAALVTAVGAVTASPGVKTTGAAQAGTSVAMTADGVRNASGAATSVTQSSGIAQWMLLITTSANIPITSSVLATATEAAVIGKSTITADGTKMQGAAAALSITAAISAQPKLEVAFTSNIGIAARVTAEASVKLNGQPGWVYDAYPAPIAIRIAVTANGARTALSYVQAATSSDCSATGQWVQGGAANMAISASITATGAADSTRITATSTMTAAGSTLMFGRAETSIAAGVVANPVNTTQGLVLPVNVAANIAVGERLALQGAGAINSASSMTADSRLALQGEASVVGSLTCEPTPRLFRYGLAQIDATASGSALWSVLRFGQAAVVVQADISAIPATNPNVRAPMARTLYVPMDSRVLVVGKEDRTMKVL